MRWNYIETTSKWALFYNSTRKELLLTLVPTMTQGVFFAHHGLPFDQILSVICSQGEIWYTPLIDDWGDSALFLEVQCSFSTNSSFSCQNNFSKKKCSYLLNTMFRKNDEKNIYNVERNMNWQKVSMLRSGGYWAEIWPGKGLIWARAAHRWCQYTDLLRSSGVIFHPRPIAITRRLK